MSKLDFRVDSREVRRYFTALSGYLTDTAVTTLSGQSLDMAEAVNQAMLLALNDASMLTCLGNDLGYERVFAKQIELYARADDLVIAISSSGRSANILNGVKAARAAKCAVVTFSGFTSDNPLRRLGDLNFYINSDRYGFVEIGHLTICHAILDFICGLRVPEGMMPTGASAA